VIFLPDSQLTSIRDCALEWTEVSQIELPPCYSDITGLSLAGLSSVTLGSNPHFVMQDNILMSFDCERLIRDFSTTRRMIEIPSSAKIISSGCFCDCESLCDVIFAAECEIEEIQARAFFHTAISEIAIPESVRVLGDRCFCDCKSLTEITFLGDSQLREIQDFAFYGTAISRLHLPEHCRKVTGSSLHGSSSINLGNTDHFVLRDDILMSVDGREMIRDFCKTREFVQIPSSVVIISAGCFCSIIALRKIEIPSHVQVLGDHCFQFCASLCDVIFEPNSQLREIRKEAFYHCGISEIEIPASVEFLGKECFCCCFSLLSVIFLPESHVREIRSRVFSYSLISAIEIPPAIEILGEGCFSRCDSLANVTFPPNSRLKVIGYEAFMDTKVSRIEIPANVFVDPEAFPRGCRIKLRAPFQ
jgi:hypothetical protein